MGDQEFAKKSVLDLHVSIKDKGTNVEIRRKEKDMFGKNYDRETTCGTCNSKFTNKHILKKHFSIVHEGKKVYECKICDSSFTSKAAESVHMSSIHEEKKPFKCPRCDFRFSGKGDMNVHCVAYV